MRLAISALVHAAATQPTAGSGREEAAFEAMVWFGALVAVVMLLALLALFLRKRVASRDAAQAPEFTLEQLREMRDCGDLTDEQYKALRDKLAAGM